MDLLFNTFVPTITEDSSLPLCNSEVTINDTDEDFCLQDYSYTVFIADNLYPYLWTYKPKTFLFGSVHKNKHNVFYLFM